MARARTMAITEPLTWTIMRVIAASDFTMTTVRVQPTTDGPDHPRERMIQSALILMGERGIEATSFSQVIEHSGAPRGSIYHHFPGGKAQLVEAATRYAGDAVVKLLGDAVSDSEGDPRAALDAVSGFWKALLWNSDFAAGCPVVAATLESEGSPAAREAARDAFLRWEAGYTELLRNADVPEERARSL